MIMGLFTNLTLIGGLLILTGIISSGTIASGGVHIYNNFKDYKCGNLNYGILIGLISLIILVLNLLLYSISCVKKTAIVIPSLMIIGSLIYNVYLFNKLDENCELFYKQHEHNLWNYYIYYLITLGVNIVLIIIGFIFNCCRTQSNSQ